MAIMKCEWCDKEFDLGSVKRRINRLYREPGFYDEALDIPLCFELETGMDRSERPDDWTFSD